MQYGVIVGCGAMGNCHGHAYKSIPGVSIIAVVDMDRTKGEALAAKLECRWISTLSELEQPKIDFIDICLPTHLHLPMILQAIPFTRNIICEKPLAVSEGEVIEIQKMVEENGLHLMVAQVLRFWDTYTVVAQSISEKGLGTIHSISCERRQKRPSWSSNNWLMNISQSGGLVFDLMIHDIDYVVWKMGKPLSVMGNIVYAEDGCPAHAKAQLYYVDCTVDIFASWGMPGSFPGASSIEVIGSHEMICCDHDGRITRVDNDGTREIPASYWDPYKEELKYFIHCCEEGISPSRCDIAQVIPSLEVARAIDESARINRLIRLTE